MLEAVVIFAAGMWAGAINVIVGSGTLVTFPTLLLFGYPPLVANMSNNVGMVAGGVSGIYGYRRELRGNAPILRRLLPASVCGGLAGALLLLVLPADAFNAVVPVLIFLGVVMVLAGPSLQRRAAQRDLTTGRKSAAPYLNVPLLLGIFALGIYGGYFGAAQGILLVGLMSAIMAESLQRITAIKNVLATLVNAVAAVTFMTIAWDRIDWQATGLIASGAFIGGYVGARVGRRLSRTVLRSVIVVIGVLAIVKMVFFD